MAANQLAAIQAFPQFFLLFQKVLHSVFLDEIQVFYHAHSIAGFVSAVNGSQPVTREIRAFKTESHFTIH